jgi:hypothetical protein
MMPNLLLNARRIGYRTSLIPGRKICKLFIFCATVQKSSSAGSFIEIAPWTCGADILVCGFTELSSSVFPTPS